jgi:hypothetical protein
MFLSKYITSEEGWHGKFSPRPGIEPGPST